MQINMQIKVCRGKSDGNSEVSLMGLSTPKDTLAVSTTGSSRRMMMYHHPPAEGRIRITTCQKKPDAYPL